MKGVKHYTTDGKVMTGATMSKSSRKVVHFKDLSKAVKAKLKK